MPYPRGRDDGEAANGMGGFMNKEQYHRLINLPDVELKSTLITHYGDHVAIGEDSNCYPATEIDNDDLVGLRDEINKRLAILREKPE